MKSSQIRACRRIFSVMLCAAAIVAYPFWASSQETYQKKFPIEHIVGDGPAFVVYAGQYGGNICVVVRSEIILFNPNSGSIISRSNLSISGYYLRINAVYQEGNILYCTTAYANTGTEIGCVFKFDLATNTLLWQKKLYAPIGTTPPSEFNSMTSDGNNSLYVSGSSLRGTYGHDVLLVKLHTNGDVIWAKNFGTDTSNDVSKGICYNSNRELYLSSTSQTAIGDVQSVIYRCDSAGNVICAKAISGSVTGRGWLVHLLEWLQTDYVLWIKLTLGPTLALCLFGCWTRRLHSFRM